MVLRWHSGDELLNKVDFFLWVQKVFLSLRKIMIEPQMEYSDDVFHTFLGIDSDN